MGVAWAGGGVGGGEEGEEDKYHPVPPGRWKLQRTPNLSTSSIKNLLNLEFACSPYWKKVCFWGSMLLLWTYSRAITYSNFITRGCKAQWLITQAREPDRLGLNLPNCLIEGKEQKFSGPSSAHLCRGNKALS